MKQIIFKIQIIVISVLSFHQGQSQSKDTLVDVGQYKLHFNIIKGTGTPILFESGSGNDGTVWKELIQPIADITGTTIITYDRAGLGKSEIKTIDNNNNNNDFEEHSILDNVIALEEGLKKIGYDILFVKRKQKMSGEKTFSRFQKTEKIELFETFMSSSSAPLLLLDIELNIIHSNQPANLLLHSDNKENLYQMIPGLIENQDLKSWLNGGSSEHFSFNTPLNSKDIDVTLSKLPDGHFQAYLLDKTFFSQIDRIRNDMEKIIRHDLKNPLNGVLGFSQLLLEDGQLGEMEREWVSFIRDSGNLMLSMMNHFLDIYKMEAGSYIPEIQNTNLIKILERLNKEFHKFKTDQLIDIIYLSDGSSIKWDDDLIIPGEEVHLETLFKNLIKNALEASPRGGIVHFQIFKNEESFEIHILNKGMIPQEIQECFFHRFSTCGKPGGKGLGTYNAKLIAQAHKGDITFTTSEEKGTELVVTLPFNHC